MNADNIHPDRGEGADLSAGLERLAAAIDRRSYAGAAWPGPRVHRAAPRRRVWLAIGTAAAAAAAVIVIVAASMRDQPLGPVPGPSPQSSAEQVAEMEIPEWTLPSEIDISLAADAATLELPSVTLPSAAEAGGMEWSVPTISLPSLTSERSNNHDM